MLQSLFKRNGIGEHLERKTFIIFTKVDELLKFDEESYEDKFENWLRGAEEIHQLITSFKLRYCVIQNKQSGGKQVQQANLVIQQLKCILQCGNDHDSWYTRVENSIPDTSEAKSSDEGFETKKLTNVRYYPLMKLRKRNSQ